MDTYAELLEAEALLSVINQDGVYDHEELLEVLAEIRELLAETMAEVRKRHAE